MKQYKAILFLLSLLVCGAAVPAYAAGKAPVIKGTPHPRGEALVKEITARSKSSAQNMNILAALSGTWDYTATVWETQDAKPQQSLGMITNEMIMDDRFLSSSAIGSLNMAGHEMPVKIQELIGYDNTHKFFTSVWIDTLGTGMMIGSGMFDKKNNVIKETGKFTNPINGAEEEFTAELRFVNTDHYSRTIFTTAKSGKEIKLMEFDYTKRN